jgi:hypothetical protein
MGRRRVSYKARPPPPRRRRAAWPSSSTTPSSIPDVRFLRKDEITRWALAQTDTPREG